MHDLVPGYGYAPPELYFLIRFSRGSLSLTTGYVINVPSALRKENYAA